MSYQWKVGELAVCICDTGYGIDDIPPKVGMIYPVRHVMGKTKASHPQLWFETLHNIPGYPPEDNFQGEAGYPQSDFRPLHGTDIRKLEEKFPEYIIKTNEVEG